MVTGLLVQAAELPSRRKRYFTCVSTAKRKILYYQNKIIIYFTVQDISFTDKNLSFLCEDFFHFKVTCFKSI